MQVVALSAAGAPVDSVDEYGWSLLHMAAARGYWEDLEALILARGDVEAVDTSGRTVLHEAADQGHAAIVKVLLAAGVDKELTDQLERTALHGAADKGHGAASSSGRQQPASLKTRQTCRNSNAHKMTLDVDAVAWQSCAVQYIEH